MTYSEVQTSKLIRYNIYFRCYRRFNNKNEIVIDIIALNLVSIS